MRELSDYLKTPRFQIKYALLFLIAGIWASPAVAQQPVVKKDSTKVYRSIEQYSKKRKTTEFLYRLFFIPVSRNAAKKPTSSNKKLNKSNRAYEGKIVRRIYITTLDPFGYSVSDTSEVPENLLSKAGNRLHIRTRQTAIRNLLLMRKNKPYDSLLVKESERLIRRQSYVHQVIVTTQLTEKKSDSVDIFIRVLDSWSIIPNGYISNSSIALSLQDKNFLGLGHDVQNNFSSNNTSLKNAFSTNYLIPNIRNTYISSRIKYQRTEDNQYNSNASIDRPFFSPLTKWAAGAYTGQDFRKTLTQINDTTYLQQQYQFITQDYWAGYAYQIFKRNTENARTTNLIFSLGFSNVRYNELPEYDPLRFYTNEDFYLSKVELSTRKYVQDKYIFNYGIIEDVPVGMNYSLTGGYKVKNNAGQYYLGARAAVGNYIDWGYLSTNLEYGTFFGPARLEQGVFSAGFNYFTNLYQIGGLKWRQFIKPKFVTGINRHPDESLNINNENGLRGFNSPLVLGNQKLIITFQTQSYLPWSLLGFQLGPYFVYSLGIVGTPASGFKNSPIYSQIGLGLLVKNNFLVFNLFQVSVAFYPVIPGTGNNVFKIDPTKTSDIGFLNFDGGKPAAVAYD